MAIALITLGAGSLAWQHRTRHITQLVVQPAPVEGVDAEGCPAGGMCDISGEASWPVSAALARAFPNATEVGGSSTSVGPEHVVYRSSATVRAAVGVLVTVVSQCVPYGGDVTGWSTVQPQDVTIVVPGDAGCSVVVSAHTAGKAELPIAALNRLAHDPAVQLHLRQ
jgi:hypothetical protein